MSEHAHSQRIGWMERPKSEEPTAETPDTAVDAAHASGPPLRLERPATTAVDKPDNSAPKRKPKKPQTSLLAAQLKSSASDVPERATHAKRLLIDTGHNPHIPHIPHNPPIPHIPHIPQNAQNAQATQLPTEHITLATELATELAQEQPQKLASQKSKSTNIHTHKHSSFIPPKSHSEPLTHLRSHSMVTLPAEPASLRRSTSRLFRANNSLATLPIPTMQLESLASPAASFLASMASPFGTSMTSLDTLLPKEGDKIERYTLGKTLGRGTFSIVLEAWASRQDLMHVGYIAPDEVGDPVCVAVKIVRKEHGGGVKLESAPAHQTTHPILHHSVSSPILLNMAKPIQTSRPSAAEFLGSLGGPATELVSPHSAPAAIAPTMPEAPQEVFNMLDHEISIWQALQHPNIVQLIEVIDTEESTFVVCESCRGGSLLDALQKHKMGLDETLAWRWFRQVVDGMLYLHTIKLVAHRDLKLENILLTWSSDASDAGVKIGDFGLSEHVGARLDKTGKNETIAGGSLPYCAPELLKREQHGGGSVARPEPDCWALGVILYALLTGSLPFHDEFAPRLQLKITRGAWDDAKLERVSEDARLVVRGLLMCDSAERWNIQRLASCLWITKGPLH